MADTYASDKYRTRFKQLFDDTLQWRSLWKEIAEYVIPERGRYLSTSEDKRNEGAKKHQKIINGEAKKALRTLAAGMQGGLTSPSRPWFTLALSDEDLMEFEPVKFWLHDVRNILLDIFARSNFYDATHGAYMELGAFGTEATLIEEDFETVVKFRPFTIGEYMIALDARQRADSLYRQFSLTARQMEEQFGKDVMSQNALSVLKNNQGETTFEIAHCIQPNKNRNPEKADRRGMRYESVYYEINGDRDTFLRRGGYRGRPFVAARWDFAGVDVYGSSPGVDALGDIKMLQEMEKKKLIQIDKFVNPPLNAPTKMKSQGGTVVPGGVNYIDIAQGGQVFTPVYQTNSNIQNVSVEIARVERRIDEIFYNDLFLAFLGDTKRKTATEVVEQHEEKLLILGPVLERLQTEKLEPTISRTFDIALGLGLFPSIPLELQGRNLKIEYISTLAQAQKIVGTTTIEQTAGFVGNLATIFPEVVDKFDADEAVDQYGMLVGTPPKIIRSDDVVAELRRARLDQQLQLQRQQQLVQATDSAKTLSETELNDKNLLETLTQGMTA